MAKVRVTPKLAPASKVPEKYVSDIYVAPQDVGMADAFSKLADGANKMYKFAKTKKKNDMSIYKSQMGMIQKEGLASMSEEVTMEGRNKVSQRTVDAMSALQAEYGYPDDEEFQNFNDLSFRGFDVSSRGLNLNLSIQEEKFKLDSQTEVFADSNLPLNLKIAEHQDMLADNVGVTITEQEAKVRDEAFKQYVNVRHYTTDTSNPLSSTSIHMSATTDPVVDTASADGLREYVEKAYETTRQEIKNNSTLKDAEKDKLLERSVSEERTSLNMVDSRLSKLHGEQLTLGKDMFVRLVDPAEDEPVTVDAEANFLDYTRSMDDKADGMALRTRYDNYLKGLSTKRKAVITASTNVAKANIARLQGILDAQPSRREETIGLVEQAVFYKKGDNWVNKDGSPSDSPIIREDVPAEKQDEYLKFYGKLKSGTDPVDAYVTKAISNLKLPGVPTGKELDGARKEVIKTLDLSDDDYDDLTENEKAQVQEALVYKVNKRATIYSHYMRAELATLASNGIDAPAPGTEEYLKLTRKVLLDTNVKLFGDKQSGTVTTPTIEGMTTKLGDYSQDIKVTPSDRREGTDIARELKSDGAIKDEIGWADWKIVDWTKIEALSTKKQKMLSLSTKLSDEDRNKIYQLSKIDEK